MSKPSRISFNFLRGTSDDGDSVQTGEKANLLSEDDAAKLMLGSGYSPVDPIGFKKLARFLAYDINAERTKSNRVGLWLTGECGRGKTFFVESCLAKHSCYQVVTASEINAWHESGGINGVFAALEQRAMYPLCIDDVGVEETGMHFGSRHDAMALVIDERCRIANSVPLSITTNLSPQQLIEKYGGRTISRLYELTCRVELSGEDQRKKMFINRNKILEGIVK